MASAPKLLTTGLRAAGASNRRKLEDSIARPRVTVKGLRLAAGNVVLAALFLTAAFPGSAYDWGSRLANGIWFVGAVTVGLLALIRRAPNEVEVDGAALISNAGALFMPTMLRVAPAPGGALAIAGIVLETLGVAISQSARVSMGRSFGMLPANRGIVTAGPFRWIRHPIYLGWLVLGLGFATYYPTVLNFAAMLATLPFMIWRIVLEERLLMHDPTYGEYCARVKTRLIPFVY